MRKKGHVLWNSVYIVSSDGSVKECWLNMQSLFIYDLSTFVSFSYGESIENAVIHGKQQLISFTEDYSSYIWVDYEKQLISIAEKIR
jgi:hypothetical protein